MCGFYPLANRSASGNLIPFFTPRPTKLRRRSLPMGSGLPTARMNRAGMKFTSRASLAAAANGRARPAGESGRPWRGDGKELFYHAPDGKLMAAQVRGGASFEASMPAPLFEFRAGGYLITPYYDVTRDGQRFLLSTIVETAPNAPLTVVTNWAAGV